MSRGALRALSGGAALHAPARPRQRDAADRKPAHRDVVCPASAPGRRPLPVLPARVPARDQPVRPLRLRPRRVDEPLCRQERARGPPRAPCVLLLFPYALRLGPLRRLLRTGPRRGRPRARAPAGGGPQALGPADGRRAPVRRDLPAYRRSDPARLRPSGGRDPAAGRRPALRDRRPGRRLLSRRGSARAVQAYRPRGRRGHPRGPPSRRRRNRPGGGPPARHGRTDGDLPRVAFGRRGRRTLRSVPGPPLSGRRGLRDHAPGGGGGRTADDRARARRRARDDDRARRGRGADGRVLRGAVGRGPRRGHRAIRGRGGAVRRQGPARARRSVRPAPLQAASARLHRRALARVPSEAGMLKAHSRLFEHVTLAVDLVIIAACWVLAYVVRFWVFRAAVIPPFEGYALQLVPILVVWGFAFRAFDLYRPNRLGSRVSEWFDVAKGSTLGVLVLVAVMTFAFRGYEYSRLVILIFLAQSIVAVSLARAALREALRFARRHGYNLRYAIVVGGGEPAAEVLRILNRRRDAATFVLGPLSDRKEVPENVRWLGGIEDVRTVLDRQQVDIVFIALPHADASRPTAVLR